MEARDDMVVARAGAGGSGLRVWPQLCSSNSFWSSAERHRGVVIVTGIVFYALRNLIRG